MYKIIDLQGSGLRAGMEFDTLEAVRESLASFHSIDVECAEEMGLNDLCSMGCWDVVTSEDISIFN